MLVPTQSSDEVVNIRSPRRTPGRYLQKLVRCGVQHTAKSPARPRSRAAVSCLVAACLALAGCSSDDPASTAPKGTITVASANFTESTIIASMYSAVLGRAGFEVEKKYNLGSRELYLRALGKSEIDLVPEYLSTLATFLVKQDDPGAESPASGDAAQTFDTLRSLAEQRKLTVYPYSPAVDQNAFAVSRATAQKYGLARLSDLAKPNVRGRLVLGGPPECPVRPYCKPGLEETYGAVFASFEPLDVGGPLTINAIAGGSVDIGMVLSSDGVVAARGLVVLDDDRRLQAADNILPLMRSDKASGEIEKLLSSVSQALTTGELMELNRRVGVDKEDPSDVAEDFLRHKGLL